jgi:translation initiation factor IF-3
LNIKYSTHFSPSGKRIESSGSSTKHRVNEQITAREIRVVDEKGAPLGIMSRNEALKLAESKELDLVEIAPNAVPPVCKIIDYGKFQYEVQKREKIQKKHQQQQQMKEIRFKWRIDTHDFNFKMRHAREFILQGNKVKASVMFRGREITYQDYGRDILTRLIAALEDIAKVDQEIKSEGKALSVILVPDKSKKKKTVEAN